MADTRVQDAIDTVARQVIYDTLESADDQGDLWGLYPDIGEGDIRLVIDQARKLTLTQVPSSTAYQAAYDFLASRADDHGPG